MSIVRKNDAAWSRLETRFWSNVDIRSADECWSWKASRDHNGYGQFSVSSVLSQAKMGSHRLAYLLATGCVADGACVMHRCDNPACCNPAHLGVGTHRDNMQDRVRKGRNAHGERNGMAKLTREQVAEIRAASGSQAHS